jgi:hypothetical protein
MTDRKQKPSKRTMQRFTRQHKRVERMVGNIAHVFDLVERNHMTHEQLLEYTAIYVYNKDDYRKLPQYEHAYLRGYIEAKRQALWAKLDWRVYHPELGHVARDQHHLLKDKWHECTDNGHFFWTGTDIIFS